MMDERMKTAMECGKEEQTISVSRKENTITITCGV